MRLTDTERGFEDVALIRGGVFMLNVVDALRFVERCRQSGVPILGVEGFRVSGEKIQPLQEHGFDLEGVEAGSHDITRTFLRQRADSDLWFEVVTADRGEGWGSAEVAARIAAMPSQSSPDGFSGENHDAVLYGEDQADGCHGFRSPIP